DPCCLAHTPMPHVPSCVAWLVCHVHVIELVYEVMGVHEPPGGCRKNLNSGLEQPVDEAPRSMGVPTGAPSTDDVTPAEVHASAAARAGVATSRPETTARTATDARRRIRNKVIGVTS